MDVKMATSEECCENNPNFAIICSFILKFGQECGVKVTISDLKQMLEDTKNISEQLKDIHIHLLRKGQKRVISKEKWEKALIKFCHEYSSVDAWELERFGYKKAKLSVKIELLKRLLELQFDSNAKFKAEVNKQDATSLRVLPIGRDIEGHAYWYQLDDDCNMRLYKIDAEDEDSWELLCTTKEELGNVISTLGSRSVKRSKLENNCEMKDEVPEVMDTSPSVKKEKIKDGLISSSDDLKATISLTNPCAIIIKSEKRDSSLLESSKADIPAIDVTEKTKQPSKCSSPLMVNGDGEKEESSKLKEQCRTLDETECEQKKVEEEKYGKRVEVDRKCPENSSSCKNEIMEANSVEPTRSPTETPSQSVNLASNEETPMEIDRTEPSKAQDLKLEGKMPKETPQTKRSAPRKISEPSTYTEDKLAEKHSSSACLNAGNLQKDLPKEESPELLETKFKGSKIKLYEKWSMEKRKHNDSAQNTTKESSRPEPNTDSSLKNVDSILDLSSKPSQEKKMDCVPIEDKATRCQELKSNAEESVVAHCSVIKSSETAEPSLLLTKTSSSSTEQPMSCIVSTSKNDAVIRKDSGGTINLHSSAPSTSLSSVSHIEPSDSTEVKKILHSTDSILSMPFKKKHRLIAEECSKDTLESNKHSDIEEKKSSIVVPLEEPIVKSMPIVRTESLVLSLKSETSVSDTKVVSSQLSESSLRTESVSQLETKTVDNNVLNADSERATESLCVSKSERERYSSLKVSPIPTVSETEKSEIADEILLSTTEDRTLVLMSVPLKSPSESDSKCSSQKDNVLVVLESCAESNVKSEMEKKEKLDGVCSKMTSATNAIDDSPKVVKVSNETEELMDEEKFITNSSCFLETPKSFQLDAIKSSDAKPAAKDTVPVTIKASVDENSKREVRLNEIPKAPVIQETSINHKFDSSASCHSSRPDVESGEVSTADTVANISKDVQSSVEHILHEICLNASKIHDGNMIGKETIDSAIVPEKSVHSHSISKLATSVTSVVKDQKHEISLENTDLLPSPKNCKQSNNEKCGGTESTCNASESSSNCSFLKTAIVKSTLTEAPMKVSKAENVAIDCSSTEKEPLEIESNLRLPKLSNETSSNTEKGSISTVPQKSIELIERAPVVEHEEPATEEKIDNVCDSCSVSASLAKDEESVPVDEKMETETSKVSQPEISISMEDTSQLKYVAVDEGKHFKSSCADGNCNESPIVEKSEKIIADTTPKVKEPEEKKMLDDCDDSRRKAVLECGDHVSKVEKTLNKCDDPAPNEKSVDEYDSLACKGSKSLDKYNDPVVKEKTTEKCDDPVIKEKTTEKCEDPVIKEKTTEKCDDPVIKEKTTEKSDDPVIKEKTTEKCYNPVITEKTTEKCDDPVIQKKTTEKCDDPVIKEKTTEKCDDPVIKEKTTEKCDDPVIKEKTTEKCDDPVIKKQTTEKCDDPVSEVKKTVEGCSSSSKEHFKNKSGKPTIEEKTTADEVLAVKEKESVDQLGKSLPEAQPSKMAFTLDFDDSQSFKDALSSLPPIFAKKSLQRMKKAERKELKEENEVEPPTKEYSHLYMPHSLSLCTETKCRLQMGNFRLNNRSFKIKCCRWFNKEIDQLAESGKFEVVGRRTSGRTRNTIIDLAPTVKTRRGRKPKGEVAPAKEKPANKSEETKEAPPDFTLPEGFLEILDGNTSKDKPEEEPEVAPKKRGRRGRPKKASIVISSESESTQSLPIKRSRRIQAQHEKKITELAVEMKKEHCRLEQLAKKNSNTTLKKGRRPAKEVVTPKTMPKAKTPAKKTPVKYQPLDIEDACLEPKSGVRKRRSRNVVNMAKMALMYDDESKDSEQSTSRSTEKSRRRRGTRGKKKGYKPWDLSSESSTSVEEISEEEEEEPEEQLVFNANEDEFACEEIEEDAEPVVVRRARTAKKTEEDVVIDDTPCCKCGKHDHPELILLCDECDDGYHMGCLIPPLIHIPDGDWYCQPCEHLFLYECLSKELQKLEQLLKQKEREELRKQRLAYVGISLDNVLKPEKKESSSEQENEVDVKVKTHKVRRESIEDEIRKTTYGKRSARSRRVNYQFTEYDELIASAIGEEFVEDIKYHEDENLEPAEKEENTDGDDDYICASATRRKRVRKLNDLNFTDEDDSGDDYKGLSTDTEHTPTENSNVTRSDSDAASGEWRIVRTKKPRKPRKRRGGRYHSSDEEEDFESDASSYRPVTRRAAQKAISYRELSSEEEWEEKKKVVKRKRKDSTSDSTEASYMSEKEKKKKKKSKWGSSSSGSEENSGESERSRDSRESSREWRIEKSNDGSRIRINKKVIDSGSDDSSRDSDKKPIKPKVRLNRVISDDSEENNNDEEDDDESEDEDDSEEEGSSKESEESDSEVSKHSSSSKTQQPPKTILSKENQSVAKAKVVLDKQKLPKLLSKTIPAPASIKASLAAKKLSADVKPSGDKPKPKTVANKLCNMKITFNPDKGAPTPPPTAEKTTVKVIPSTSLPANIAKDVAVCRAAVAANREKITSNQIVVQTVVVKTVPKGVIKEIKMVPSKIQYRDKIDSSETESENPPVEPIKKEAASTLKLETKVPPPPPPNLQRTTPEVKSVAGEKSQPVTPVVASKNPANPHLHQGHPPAITAARAGMLSKPYSPVLEQHQGGNLSPRHMPMKSSIPQRPFSSVIERHVMHQGIPMQGSPGPQPFPGVLVQHPGGPPLPMPPQQQPPMPMKNILMRSLRPGAIIEPQNNINMMHQMMPAKNTPPPPNQLLPFPGTVKMEPQGHAMPLPPSKTSAPPKPFTSTIVEPFSTADVDQNSDSRDEVPLERIPCESSENSNIAFPPGKNAPFTKEDEYRPAKESTSYSYNLPEEKGFPATYSPLSSLQEFTSRPSPLKPSLVETFSGNSSPTRLTPLDSYSQTSSPKGFISLDSYPRKKGYYGNPPHDSVEPRPSGNTYPGEGRFEQESFQCSPSSGSYRQQSPSVQQRDMGTPPRLYSQFPDSYAPPRSPEFYQNQQYYNIQEEGGPSRPGYQPNFTPGEPGAPYPFIQNPMQQSNDGFMIDTILRARNEEDELGNVSGIVQYITQQ